MMANCPTNIELTGMIEGTLASADSVALEAHLDQCVRCRRRLDGLAGGDESWLTARHDMARDPTCPPSLRQAISRLKACDDAIPGAKPGDRIGRYKLLQQIGEGGCGVVYMAEQEEPVHRRVALKVIKPGMDTRSVIARFEAERQALALMDHPHIAKVLDAGATATGRPFFVMELVRGRRITEYCDEAKLSTRARLGLFILVCQAIQHAHQKGIIHRDIKPSNVLVTVNDGVAVPKVIDFGIAKATAGQKLTDRTLFTAFEQFVGTPAYMSPEQAVLTSQDIDTRSDLYALGVLLYELLTGRTPFDSKELLSAGLDEMRRAIREREPTRPSTRLSTLPGDELNTTAQRRGIEAPRLVTELRGDLDWIVMKCLEKDRGRRYETASHLAADIQRHLTSEPVVARPPSRLYRLRKGIRRNRLAFAAAGAVLISLAVGLTVATVLLVRERAARTQAHDQAAIAQAVSDFLQIDLLEQAGPLDQALEGFTPDPNLTVRQALNRAARRIGTRFKDKPLQEAAIQNAIGAALRAVGEAERAIPHLQRAVELNQAGLGVQHRETLGAMHNLALAYATSGRLDQAVPLFEKTLTLMRSHLGVRQDSTLGLMNDLAWAYLETGDLGQALPLYEENLRRQEALSGPEDVHTLGAMNNLALGHRRAGHVEEATRLLVKAVELMKRRLRLEHPYTQNAMSNLAECYRDTGRFGPALDLFQTVVKQRQVNLGPEDPATLNSMADVAETQRMAGNPAAAEAAYRDVLGRVRSISRDGSPREIPQLGFILHHLADLLRERHQLAESRALAEQALDAYDRHADWPIHERQHAFTVLQSVLQECGEPQAIEPVRARHTAALHAAAEKDDLSALNNLAWMLATSDDAARRDGRTAVRLAQRAVAKTGRKDPGILDTLAAAYAAAGEFSEAAAAQREAIALTRDSARQAAFAERLKLYEQRQTLRQR